MGIPTLDLFCGGGGSSLGATKAGAEIILGVDAWPLAIATYNANFNGRGREFTMLPDTKPSEFGLKKGDIELLLASPECTNHTCAKGARPRCEDSKRTANYVINFARDLQPEWIVLENVVHMKKWDGFSDLIHELQTTLRYKCTVQVLDASDFGVPQSRRRMFVMCSRHDKPDLIKPMGTESPNVRSIFDPVMGPGAHHSYPWNEKPKAPSTQERYNRAIGALGKGKDFLIVYYGSDAAGGWQTLDRPLRTITTIDRFGLVTWQGGKSYFRMLQVPELMRAMGFRNNDRHSFLGTRREQIKQIGNGVCPPVMEVIVQHLTSGRIAAEPVRVTQAHGQWPSPASCTPSAQRLTAGSSNTSAPNNS